MHCRDAPRRPGWARCRERCFQARDGRRGGGRGGDRWAAAVLRGRCGTGGKRHRRRGCMQLHWRRGRQHHPTTSSRQATAAGALWCNRSCCSSRSSSCWRAAAAAVQHAAVLFAARVASSAALGGQRRQGLWRGAAGIRVTVFGEVNHGKRCTGHPPRNRSPGGGRGGGDVAAGEGRALARRGWRNRRRCGQGHQRGRDGPADAQRRRGAGNERVLLVEQGCGGICRCSAC